MQIYIAAYGQKQPAVIRTARETNTNGSQSLTQHCWEEQK